MNKKVFFLVLLIFIFPNVYANNIYQECIDAQDSNISATGTGDFSFCMKAKCINGVWQTYYWFGEDIFKCANGNKDYYYYIKSGSTCHQYIGSCSTDNVTYCIKKIGYDCDKTSNSSIYIPSSSPITQRPSTQTPIIPPTTKKPPTTNKPVTTKKPTTTKKPPTTTTTTTQAPKDNNSFLKTLDVVNHHIEFNKEILSYEIIIEKDEKSLDVKYEAESDKAIANIQNNENIDITKPIIVKVTAEDGTFKEYTINAKYREISSNKNVKNITVDSYDLGFDSTKFEYDLVINSSETELTINVELEDEKTKYEINGNSNLENGSVITIDVKAEDESSITYKINIIKEVEIVPKKSGVGKVITTIIILILLGVIGVVAFKFIRNILPAKADENYDYE